ncbi:MAG: hypothetical protein V7K64_31180 [Nostoc sp.]|uniref:hypothetical protein n=1 Tax=Nostoc sp. TaxID=1180 RepID=UPI002FFC8995
MRLLAIALPESDRRGVWRTQMLPINITPASSERTARFVACFPQVLARRRWKRLMLPLHHTRIKLVTGIEPATY